MKITQKLLNIDNNAKTVKGQKKGYLTAILYLAPADLSGYNVCPAASAGCKSACLNTSGRGRMTMVQEARVKKTKLLFEHENDFLIKLDKEISAFKRYAKKKDLIPCVRLNGTSDIKWETKDYVDHNDIAHESLIHKFHDIQFYDYTKMLGRKIPKNYHLTFSRAEDNQTLLDIAIKRRVNVAMVFGNVPVSYNKKKVVIGDENDLRFLDKKGSIVGLYAKGRAKKDKSGFVIQ